MVSRAGNFLLAYFFLRNPKKLVIIFFFKLRFSLKTDEDFFMMLKWLQYILLVIVQPILSSLGIINNFILICIVKNKEYKKLFKDQMYKHMLINAYFNIAFSAILLLNLINECVFYASTLSFCSKAYLNETSQYVKIIIVNFLGNALKICTNVSYIFFAFSRFVLVSNLKEKYFFKSFTNLNLKLYAFTLFMGSILLSLFKLFQYRINDQIDFRKDFPYEIQDVSFCSESENFLTCRLFYVFNIVNNSINDIICFFLNIVIDCFLIKNLKKNLENKQALTQASSSNDISIHKSRKKINHMVIWNGVIYFVAHMPEFVCSILLIVFSKSILDFCQEKLSCDLINEEAQTFTLISIVCQLYVFLGFNKNIRISQQDLVARFWVGLKSVFKK
jgi:hypothetical protein